MDTEQITCTACIYLGARLCNYKRCIACDPDRTSPVYNLQNYKPFIKKDDAQTTFSFVKKGIGGEYIMQMFDIDGVVLSMPIVKSSPTPIFITTTVRKNI